MARCLPLLAPPIEEHAPTVIALCRRLEQSNAGLAALARRDAERYGELLRSTHCGGGMWAVILCAQAATLCIPGELYCGGMIEKSIRQVLAAGRDGRQ